MKRLIAFMVLCVAGAGARHTAFAQPNVLPSLSIDSSQNLQELRLGRTKRNLLESNSLAQLSRQRLLELADHQLMGAALRDQSLPSVELANKSVAARLRLFDIANIAQSDDGAQIFADKNLTVSQLLDWARQPAPPTEQLKQVEAQFEVDSENRVMIRPRILEVNPEANAPDNTPPGHMPSGYVGPALIWRAGLLFAVALGTSTENRNEFFCSGTVVAKYWVITAAHCLRHKGVRLSAGQLHAFFPFQGGSLQVYNPRGGIDSNLRKVGVTEVVWLGDKTGTQFPDSESSESDVILAGMDIAMLHLATAEVDALPASIEEVRLFGGHLDPPVSMVGYGISNKPVTENLSLMVGVRNSNPIGVAEDLNLLIYGKPIGERRAGICGGDSGGGLFAGRIDGQPGNLPRLIGVASGLIAATDSSSVNVCLASQEGHASLMSARNRQFVCEKAPAACT